MKKFSFTKIIVLIYELIRTFFILKAAPVQDIPVQSLSWYVAAPLLCLPFVFLLLIFIDDNKFRVFYPFAIFSKLMSVVSMIAYIPASLKDALIQLKMNQIYSINTIIFMMFFLLIDVIIGVTLTVKYSKGDVCR